MAVYRPNYLLLSVNPIIIFNEKVIMSEQAAFLSLFSTDICLG